MWSRVEILWRVALVAAFVACGLYGFASGRSRRVDGNGPLNSMDALLSEALRVNQPAEQITTALSALGNNGPVAILVPPGDTYGKLLLPEIGSIAWPRQIYLVHCGDAEVRKNLLALRDRHFAAALVYHLSPPTLPSDVRRIGRLTIVPIAQ